MKKLDVSGLFWHNCSFFKDFVINCLNILPNKTLSETTSWTRSLTFNCYFQKIPLDSITIPVMPRQYFPTFWIPTEKHEQCYLLPTNNKKTRYLLSYSNLEITKKSICYLTRYRIFEIYSKPYSKSTFFHFSILQRQEWISDEQLFQL